MPWIVTDALPLPTTLAPEVPVATVRVPAPTDRVAISIPPPLSTSLTDSPVFFRLKAVCSVAL